MFFLNEWNNVFDIWCCRKLQSEVFSWIVAYWSCFFSVWAPSSGASQHLRSAQVTQRGHSLGRSKLMRGRARAFMLSGEGVGGNDREVTKWQMEPASRCDNTEWKPVSKCFLAWTSSSSQAASPPRQPARITEDLFLGTESCFTHPVFPCELFICSQACRRSQGAGLAARSRKRRGSSSHSRATTDQVSPSVSQIFFLDYRKRKKTHGWMGNNSLLAMLVFFPYRVNFYSYRNVLLLL